MLTVLCGFVACRQMWTAFGIMIGNVMDLAFFHVPDPKHNIKGLNWRLMLASVRPPPLSHTFLPLLS